MSTDHELALLSSLIRHRPELRHEVLREAQAGATVKEVCAKWYRQLWEARFNELDKVVEELKRKEKIDGCKKRE